MRDPDINAMSGRFLAIAVFAVVLFAAAANAQIPSAPGTSPVIPFPSAPPPPPPPPITVPTVPQMNSPPRFELQNTTPSRVDHGTYVTPKVRRQRRELFGDRMARCLDEGAAMGLGPNERAAYSRVCANQ